MAQDFYLKQASEEFIVTLSAQSQRGSEALRLAPQHCDNDGMTGPSCVSTLCAQTSCSDSTGRDIAKSCGGN